MKKMPTVFVRDWDGDRSRVTREVHTDCQWVLDGEGIATEKLDGTCCLVRGGLLYKRYDRKLTKAGRKKLDSGEIVTLVDFKGAPDGFEPCEPEPDLHTGHWPGWLAVGDGPEDQWHRTVYVTALPDLTYELVGPKFQGNPYNLTCHRVWPHGGVALRDLDIGWVDSDAFCFDGIRGNLERCRMEGVVWHHPDGRMAKIKRSDFGLLWPGPAGRARFQN